MQLSLSSSPFSGLTPEDTLALIGSREGLAKDPAFQELDHAHESRLTKILEEEDYAAKWKKICLLRLNPPGPGRIFFVGLEDAKLPVRRLLIQAGGLALDQAKAIAATRLVIAFAGPLPNGMSRRAATRLLAEGALLADHSRFTHKAKSEEDEKKLQQLAICWPGQDTLVLRTALDRAEILARAANTARDLVNEPAGSLFPESFADRVAKLAGSGVTVTAHDTAWLQEKSMGGILGVSAGSAREPRLVEVEYRPAEDKNSDQAVLLVGKGVTYDSGGLVLKPPEGLKTMKCDMGGAAVLAGITSILHELKPNRPVRILIPLAENMTGGAATKVGDVLHMHSGKTVEVMNTDAEGRLILADALAYGAQKSPSVVFDLATLTGASVVALGKLCSTVMGNSPEVVRDVLSSAEKAGELMWELPLIEVYKKQLESKTADLKNVGERWGGAITAALFLSEFVNELPWAHLDIAGPTWADKDEPAFPEGGTAHGIGTVIELLSPSEE